MDRGTNIMEWDTIGKLWVLLLGATLLFEMFKYVIKKIGK